MGFVSGNIAKPVLDVIIYNAKLSQNVGAEGLIALTAIVQVSAALRKPITTLVRPSRAGIMNLRLTICVQ